MNFGHFPIDVLNYLSSFLSAYDWDNFAKCLIFFFDKSGLNILQGITKRKYDLLSQRVNLFSQKIYKFHQEEYLSIIDQEEPKIRNRIYSKIIQQMDKSIGGYILKSPFLAELIIIRHNQLLIYFSDFIDLMNTYPHLYREIYLTSWHKIVKLLIKELKYHYTYGINKFIEFLEIVSKRDIQFLLTKLKQDKLQFYSSDYDLLLINLESLANK